MADVMLSDIDADEDSVEVVSTPTATVGKVTAPSTSAAASTPLSDAAHRGVKVLAFWRENHV
jgi:hypothetical protein